MADLRVPEVAAHAKLVAPRGEREQLLYNLADHFQYVREPRFGSSDAPPCADASLPKS